MLLFWWDKGSHTGSLFGASINEQPSAVTNARYGLVMGPLLPFPGPLSVDFEYWAKFGGWRVYRTKKKDRTTRGESFRLGW